MGTPTPLVFSARTHTNTHTHTRTHTHKQTHTHTHEIRHNAIQPRVLYASTHMLAYIHTFPLLCNCPLVPLLLAAGALVHWVWPYSVLKPANVTGTSEILRLSCCGLCFIATQQLVSRAADCCASQHAQRERESERMCVCVCGTQAQREDTDTLPLTLTLTHALPCPPPLCNAIRRLRAASGVCIIDSRVRQVRAQANSRVCPVCDEAQALFAVLCTC